VYLKMPMTIRNAELVSVPGALLPRLLSFRHAILFFFTLTGLSGSSQTLELGLFGGGSYYIGDLNPGKHFINTQLAYGITARYNIDTRWAVTMSGYAGKIKGNSSNSFRPDNQLAFESNLTDISAVVEFNFLPYFTGSHKDFFAPYIYTGLSLFFYDPMANGTSLRSLGTEGQNIGFEGRSPYGSTGIGVPMGLGVKLSLARNLGMTVFWQIHKTFTDYLDDASQTFYLVGANIDATSMEEVLSDPSKSHQPYMERGNPSNNDWYSFTGITLTYKFNLSGRKKCRDTKFM
jgi:hypothetical protein